MSDEQTEKMQELDRLLNDPDICLQPGLIWALADALAAASKPG